MEILSRRNLYKWPSWHLVWEWEDVISDKTGWKLYTDNIISHHKILRIFPCLKDFLRPSFPTFLFEMSVDRFTNNRRYNNENFFPCIIDYFLRDDDLSIFEKNFSEHHLIFISSKEVYDRLKSLNTQLPIVHLPLSLPDYYRLEPNTEKKKEYDVALVGRVNPVLLQYMIEYAQKHPTFIYIQEDQRKRRKFHYYASNGEYVGYYRSRKQYMDLISKSRVALYSTPGIDGGESRTNGYNQVTPKFLEYLASGCNIICRWQDNPDTDFFHLNSFSNNIQTYKQFEEAMDKSLSVKPDLHRYAEYLNQHYTSKRVNMLCKYLNNYL